MFEDISEVLVTEKQIEEKITEMAKQINEDYRGKNLLVLGILKGSFIFASDLIRKITIPCEVDFMSVSSYGSGVKTSGVVKIVKDVDIKLEGLDILIAEDILDSGMTLSYLIQLLKGRNPNSIKVCTLLDKPERRIVSVNVDYKGFEIPDEFVVGYGLDYNEQYRNLPFVGVLKKEIYTK